MASNLTSPRDLSAGDVILEAEPIVHVMYVSLKGIHCDYCLKRCASLTKCVKCLNMHYCGPDCEQKDWKYHKNECFYMSQNVVKPFETTDEEMLLFRLWLCLRNDSKFGTKTYKLMDGTELSFNDIAVDFKKLLQYYPRNFIIYKELYKMIQNFAALGLDFCYSYDEQLLGLLLIIKSQIRQPFDWCNSDISASCDERDFIMNVGIGLFPQLMTARHSCVPNSAIVTNGNKLGVANGRRSVVKLIICPAKENSQNRLKIFGKSKHLWQLAEPPLQVEVKLIPDLLKNSCPTPFADMCTGYDPQGEFRKFSMTSFLRLIEEYIISPSTPTPSLRPRNPQHIGTRLMVP